MKIKEAVSLRILQLCAEKGLAINALANLGGNPADNHLQHIK